MPIDPHGPIGLDAEQRRADALADLQRRVTVLEHGAPVIQTGLDAPITAPRDGTPYVATTATRLWLRVNGEWRYVQLT